MPITNKVKKKSSNLTPSTIFNLLNDRWIDSKGAGSLPLFANAKERGSVTELGTSFTCDKKSKLITGHS